MDTLLPGAESHAGSCDETLKVLQGGDDRYVIEEEIARGGQAVILRAYDRRLCRVVALKQLRVQNGTTKARFINEAMITARLAHPSIVPVHDVNMWADGTPYFAMKLIVGETLEARLQSLSGDPLARRRLVSVVVDVVAAIAYAHRERVVHRDLKPSNVLLSEFGQTVVIDWGIAETLVEKQVSKPPLTVAANQRRVFGTPGFMAPEQAAGRDVDERTDVYSLGVILYLVIIGRSPFGNRSARDFVERVGHGASPAPLHLVAPDIDPMLASIVDRALENDPSVRFANGSEMLAALSAVLPLPTLRQSA